MRFLCPPTTNVVKQLLLLCYNEYKLQFVYVAFYHCIILPYLYIYMYKKFILLSSSCCFSWLETNTIILYNASCCYMPNDTFLLISVAHSSDDNDVCWTRLMLLLLLLLYCYYYRLFEAVGSVNAFYANVFFDYQY